MSAIILHVLIYAVPNCSPIRGFHPGNASLMEAAHGDVQATNGDDHHGNADHKKRSADDHHADESLHEVDNYGNASDHAHDPYGWHGHGYVFRVSSLQG